MPVAAEQDDRGAGGDVVEVGDGAHEVTVGVGWQRAGQRNWLPGDVAAVQHRAGGSLFPAPDGDVVEEAAERDDGADVPDQRHRSLPDGGSAAGGALPVVGQERLEVVPVQLGEGGHTGERVVQPLCENDEHGCFLDHGLGSLGGGQHGQVAQHHGADPGLRDGLQSLGELVLSVVRVLFGSLGQAELEAHVRQRVMLGPQVLAGRRGQRRGPVDLAADRVQHVLVDLLEPDPLRQADQGQRVVRDSMHVVRAPSQPGGAVPNGAHLRRVQRHPGRVVPTLSLAGQQVQIRAQSTGGEAPGQERPATGLPDHRDPVRARAAHPGPQVRDDVQEPLSAGQSQPLRLRVARQRCHESRVIGQQPRPDQRVDLRSRRCGQHGVPSIADRAWAYSAANAATDRCTYRAVVSGLA